MAALPMLRRLCCSSSPSLSCLPTRSHLFPSTTVAASFRASNANSCKTLLSCPSASRVFGTSAAALSGHASSAGDSVHCRRKLVLYSKKGCCLCDGLKEKLEAVFLMDGEDSLADVQLEIRDISTNPEWETAYQYEIPVLARVSDDNAEIVLPRLSPRLSIEQIHRKLSAALK